MEECSQERTVKAVAARGGVAVALLVAQPCTTQIRSRKHIQSAKIILQSNEMNTRDKHTNLESKTLPDDSEDGHWRDRQHVS